MESGATGTSDKKAISSSNALMQDERADGAKGIEKRRLRVDPSIQESLASGENGDVRRDEKGVKRDPSSPSRKAVVIDEVVPDEESRLESGTVEKVIVRVRREPTKGRGSLPKRKTSREQNAAEAWQRAYARLRSVRDGRGYIDFNFI
jgi:hypothetical protein